MNKTIFALVALVVLYLLFFRRGEGYTPLRAAWRYALQETSPNAGRRVTDPFNQCSPEEWPCK